MILYSSKEGLSYTDKIMISRIIEIARSCWLKSETESEDILEPRLELELSYQNAATLLKSANKASTLGCLGHTSS